MWERSTTCPTRDHFLLQPQILSQIYWWRNRVVAGNRKLEHMGDCRGSSGDLIILDWDDTILPSSWVAGEGLRLDEPQTLPEAVVQTLRPLEESAVKLITQACNHGPVVIITNAETGWVELSAKRFLPAVVPILARLRVVSARSAFEAQFPNSPQQWKLAAFHQEIEHQCAAEATADNVPVSVTSLGDSVHEREALHGACQLMGNCLTKSVKFVEHPNVEQLRRELDLVVESFDNILHHSGCLDLMLSVSMNTVPKEVPPGGELRGDHYA